MWPKDSELKSFFGDPAKGGRNGQANARWEAENLVVVPAPWRMVAAWNQKPVRGARVNRKCAESLARVLAAIWAASGQSENKIREWGCDQFGGGYNFRLKRGGSTLSTHAYGCAIDLDPERNRMGLYPNFKSVPAVVSAFESEGWLWGGRWDSPDGMHFQAAS